jgi:hypothetical protein
MGASKEEVRERWEGTEELLGPGRFRRCRTAEKQNSEKRGRAYDRDICNTMQPEVIPEKVMSCDENE